MGKVYDYDNKCETLCPFTGDTCFTECMMMRPNWSGEPKCSMRVIADELVNINSSLQDIREACEKGRL